MAQQILVCDDEPHVVRAIALKFTRAGFDVRGVADAESCWRHLDSHEPPALLIVDFSNPHGADAADLVRRIRSDVRLADLPVIVLTANTFDTVAEIQMMQSLDVSQIFSKPFSPREVLATTCQLVSRGIALHHFREVRECSMAANL